MQENKEHRILDKFTKKMIQTAGVQSPSEGFTLGILERIAAEGKAQGITEIPALISTRAWIWIGGGVAALLTALFIMQPIDNQWPSLFDKWQLPTFDISFGFSFSPIWATISVCFMIVFIAYIVLMQRVLVRRF